MTDTVDPTNPYNKEGDLIELTFDRNSKGKMVAGYKYHRVRHLYFPKKSVGDGDTWLCKISLKLSFGRYEVIPLEKISDGKSIREAALRRIHNERRNEYYSTIMKKLARSLGYNSLWDMELNEFGGDGVVCRKEMLQLAIASFGDYKA